jgi:hypothetical protein
MATEHDRLIDPDNLQWAGAPCSADLGIVPLFCTTREIETLTRAMAGDFPEHLDKYRMTLLRKLTRAGVFLGAMS